MIPSDDEQRLLELALTVADGSAVDWASRRAETPQDGKLLDGLRDIARVAEQHVTAEPPPPARPRETWGPLHLLRRLGEGSFGEVWEAWDPALDRPVALKLRRVEGDGAGSRRWLEEGRRLARVHHPNVLAVFGADVHDGRAGIWTERLEGVTLEAWLEANGPMGAREAALVGLDLCAALAAVHAGGLVHGDVKPANVMRGGAASGELHASGRIVLVDFGSAAEKGGALGVGTPLAMAPEVLEGRPPGPASDVYSLGVLLFRLVTARWPADATSLEGLRQTLARGERLALRTARPDLPRAFVEVVERALEFDPAARFADAASMERALAAVVAPSATPSPPRRSRRAPAALVAVVVIGAIGFAAWRMRAERAPAALAPEGAPRPERASTGPAAVAPAATAPAPLGIEATLVREGEAGPERLENGDRVGPGDRLHVELRSAARAQLYVLEEDDSSHVFLLFPLAGRGARNPLAPGTHRLPGRDAGGEMSWEVTSAGGRETFLVVASLAPLPALQHVLDRATAAQPDAPVEYPALDAGALGAVRGVGGVTHRAAAAGPRGLLAALAERLRQAPADSVWERLVVLRNPARP